MVAYLPSSSGAWRDGILICTLIFSIPLLAHVVPCKPQNHGIILSFLLMIIIISGDPLILIQPVKELAQLYVSIYLYENFIAKEL